MDILNKIIQLMDKEELRNFKLLAQRIMADEDRKDIQLFDFMRKTGDKFRERTIQKRLYGSTGKNKYYRLKNRLHQEVGKSLTMLNWNRNTTFLSFHYLILAILFREKQQFEIAYYYLKRSEAEAAETQKPELLDIIYGEFILLSFDHSEINPETYIQLRETNLETLNRLRKIDNILATISYRIKISQNFSPQDSSILELLEKTVTQFSDDPEIKNNPQFIFRMYHAVSKILLQKRDYVSLEKYLLVTWEKFSDEKLFTRNNHDTKLQILTYLINALYKNGKSEESLQWTEKLKESMLEFGGMLNEKYLFFYFNSQAYNYIAKQPEKSIEILEGMLENDVIMKVPSQAVIIHLNLALFLFEMGKWKQAIRSLIKLMLLDAFLETDESLRIRIILFELALRFKLSDFDVILTRVQQVKNEYSTVLAKAGYKREYDLFSIMESLAQSEDPKNDKLILKASSDFMEKYETNDTEIFKYKEWLTTMLDLK